MKVRNRIVMPPMGTNFSSPDGYVTEQLKNYYEARAKGGVGLIIVEYSCIDLTTGKGGSRQLGIDRDEMIPGLSELSKVIKQHGAKAAIQLHHAGRMASSRWTGRQSVAPSPIPVTGGEMPRELSSKEIEDIISKFAEGAERAKGAGFDGVELHATHGYLLSQFLSAASNRRQDAYGGDLRSRARIVLDILTAVKKRVGPDYPVWVRLTGVQFGVNKGITLEESRQVARWLEVADAAAINVSAEGSLPAHAMAWRVKGEKLPRPPMDHPVGFLIPVAEAIKKAVKIPVIVVGRMNPEAGEKVLREGKADMVAMGRPIIADPELPAKTASGDLEDVRPCIACLVCRERLLSDEKIGCAVNAAAGREKEAVVAALKRKRVLVIGGGPGGMEAARVAAMRGHQVTIWDKGESLGGQLLLASLPPHKGELTRLTNYLKTQLEKLGVKVELRKEASYNEVITSQSDVVIMATGSKPHSPELGGRERGDPVEARDVLAGKAEVGLKVVVVGGGIVGCETAEFLGKKGIKVTVVEMLDRLAREMIGVHREYLLDRMSRLGINTITGAKVEAFTDRGLLISYQEGERVLEADTIVLAAGARPNLELYGQILGQVPAVCLAGDCIQPHGIKEAITKGFDVGREI
jgi:2,4-dienoyl-CoA reductase-like NADH-dependent reductase (Old Yellow Enzyme family)/thioredoxin reductase